MKDSSSTTISKLYYKPNAESNLHEWIKQISRYLLKEYGQLAKFIDSLAYYVPPEIPVPDPADMTPIADPTGMVKKNYKNEVEERFKHIREMKQNHLAMWGDIELHMSKVSLDEVMADPSYQTLKDAEDVLGFWKLILKVHRSTGGIIKKDDVITDALKNYYSIHQEEREKLVVFRDRFEAAIQRISAADDTRVPTPSEQGQYFIKQLDPYRYSLLMLKCEQDNYQNRADAYPKTLADAFQTANAHKALDEKTGKLTKADYNFNNAGGQLIAAGGKTSSKDKDEKELSKSQKKRKKYKANLKKRLDRYGDEKDVDNDEYANAGGAVTKKKKYNNNNNSAGGESNSSNGDKPKWCSLCRKHAGHWSQHCPQIPEFHRVMGIKDGNSNSNNNNTNGFIPL
jgi:hypothetical protein